MPAFGSHALAGATVSGIRTTVRSASSRVGAVLRRRFAAFQGAQERRAAILVLPHLEERIRHTAGDERAGLVARVEELRRSLGERGRVAGNHNKRTNDRRRS